jgi:DNA repair exonuclease SbcCD ATPase subunit
MMMSTNRVRRVVVTGAAIALGVAAVAWGQAGQPPAAARTQMDELLAEVRGLRADLAHASAASQRGQLLGMRLQSQEQRITALARQLSDVQQQLRANAQARAALLGPLKMFAAMKDETSLGKADGFNAFLAPLKQQLAALDKSDAELKAEETYLTGQLSDEQSRWNAFNSQIEELERSAGKAVR